MKSRTIVLACILLSAFALASIPTASAGGGGEYCWSDPEEICIAIHETLEAYCAWAALVDHFASGVYPQCNL